VRTETHKLIRYEQLDEWELFDLERDPDELASVHDDPEYAELRASLEAELARLAVHYGEPDPLAHGSVVLDQSRARRRAARVAAREVFRLADAGTQVPSGPDLAAKPFTVAALVDGGDGVVIAQGGASFGYALWLDDRAPVVTVSNRDARFEARGEALPATAAHLAASLDAGGVLRLFVDGALVARTEAQVLEQRPADGLTVGSDGGSQVGPYQGGAPLQGSWSDVRFAWGAGHDLSAWAQAARGR